MNLVLVPGKRTELAVKAKRYEAACLVLDRWGWIRSLRRVDYLPVNFAIAALATSMFFLRGPIHGVIYSVGAFLIKTYVERRFAKRRISKPRIRFAGRLMRCIRWHNRLVSQQVHEPEGPRVPPTDSVLHDARERIERAVSQFNGGSCHISFGECTCTNPAHPDPQITFMEIEALLAQVDPRYLEKENAPERREICAKQQEALTRYLTKD